MAVGRDRWRERENKGKKKAGGDGSLIKGLFVDYGVRRFTPNKHHELQAEPELQLVSTSVQPTRGGSKLNLDSIQR